MARPFGTLRETAPPSAAERRLLKAITARERSSCSGVLKIKRLRCAHGAARLKQSTVYTSKVLYQTAGGRKRAAELAGREGGGGGGGGSLCLDEANLRDCPSRALVIASYSNVASGSHRERVRAQFARRVSQCCTRYPKRVSVSDKLDIAERRHTSSR